MDFTKPSGKADGKKRKSSNDQEHFFGWFSKEDWAPDCDHLAEIFASEVYPNAAELLKGEFMMDMLQPDDDEEDEDEDEDEEEEDDE